MIHDEVATLRTGDEVRIPRYQASGIRGRVEQAETAGRVRITWVDSRYSHDTISRTSPLWSVIERAPK